MGSQLTREELEQVVEAAARAHILGREGRDILLFGLSNAASLRELAAPWAQALSDLMTLAGIEAMEGCDGPPVARWLDNAVLLAGAHPDAQVFRRVAQRVRSAVMPPAPPPSAHSARRLKAPIAQVLDRSPAWDQLTAALDEGPRRLLAHIWGDYKQDLIFFLRRVAGFAAGPKGGHHRAVFLAAESPDRVMPQLVEEWSARLATALGTPDAATGLGTLTCPLLIAVGPIPAQRLREVERTALCEFLFSLATLPLTQPLRVLLASEYRNLGAFKPAGWATHLNERAAALGLAFPEWVDLGEQCIPPWVEAEHTVKRYLPPDADLAAFQAHYEQARDTDTFANLAQLLETLLEGG